MSESNYETPMMQQYLAIKKDHMDAILLFRMGDFYEMFQEDAQLAAKVLGITLTARHKGKDGSIPMCGVPYHSAEGYIQRLVRAGYKAAICEQVSTPTSGPELVEREVIRVVTPSTLLSDTADDGTDREFLLTLAIVKDTVGFAFIAARSGQVLVAQESLRGRDLHAIVSEYALRFQPAEALLSQSLYEDVQLVQILSHAKVSPFRFDSPFAKPREAMDMIQSLYKVHSLESFGISDASAIQMALAQGLQYLTETQRTDLTFLKPPVMLLSEQYMYVSGQTIRNLELFSALRTGDSSTSLFGTLDQTITAMGKRLLRMWLVRPLRDIAKIQQRLSSVQWFIENASFGKDVRGLLVHFSDIERSLSRLSLGIGTPRDLVALRTACDVAQQINSQIPPSSELLQQFRERIDWNKIQSISELLHQSIAIEPSIQVGSGNVVTVGFDPKLDELRELAAGGQEWINQLEQRERETTGIASLKIAHNKVFGYYIEISQANSSKAPAHYIRKQTLTNAERYIIQELKEYEDKVFSAQDQIFEKEKEIYSAIVQKTLGHTLTLQTMAEFIAQLDVLSAFAAIAQERRYVCPEFVEEPIVDIKEGRHPVVELMSSSRFVPNDVFFDDDHQMMVLTGANMAGKSTYIRQVALLTIMAHMGCFVPAKSMRVGSIDQVHTRIGAMDNVAEGLSTFMVEMIETAQILHSLTDRSLVILDEIGRGTSTYDGLSIAWSVSEYVLNHSKANVLFATHYFELTQLAETNARVSNFHMAVSDESHGLVFLYEVRAGSADQSYGIEAAELAGLPNEVISRAREILGGLNDESRTKALSTIKQMRLFFV